MINNLKYTPLHIHNELSPLDGMFSSEQWAERSKEIGFTHLALTNHHNMDGAIKHQAACDKFGIIPIQGVEFYIVPNPEIKEKGEFRSHCTVWVKSQEGFENCLRLLTSSNLDYFYYMGRIGFDMLLDNCAGLCISTACSASWLHQQDSIPFLEKLYKKIGDDLYLELMPFSDEKQILTNNLCLDLSEKYGIKTIVSSDAHYINKEDSDIHDTLLAMQTKKLKSDLTRWKFSGSDFFLSTPEELYEQFVNQGVLYPEEIKQAFNNTLEIAEKCGSFRIDKKEIILPTPPQFKGMDEETVLRDLCEEGFKNKLDVVTEEYRERFEYELSVIKDFGVIKYFLIIYDLVNFCNDSGILTGPGRGSAAGCLISYLLGITKVDPIVFGLLFERFLNPGRRGAMPDCDLDFEHHKRDQVVNYLKNVYGEGHVCGISTYLKIEAKGAIRDVCRTFEIPLKEADVFSKSVTDNIEIAFQSAEGVEFKAKYPEASIHIARLAGLCKSYGRHAAASLISPVDLRLGTRTALAERNGQLVACLDGNDCEAQGLVKLDILGLNAMSILAMTIDLIKQNHGKDIILEKIPLDDKKVYEEISNANTVGGFQINTFSLKQLLKRMKPKDIFQLSDVVAGVRPGAQDSGATDTYIARKNGEKWEPKHPIYEEICQKTFGVIFYQEQVIQTIHKIAGFSLAEADEVRRIVAKKKDVTLLEKFKDKFISGCLEQKTFSEEEAERFWDDLGHHADYSFNLSHSICYSIIAYWTIWLKLYYSDCFICASLTYGGDAEKHDLITEAQRLGLKIQTPKLETSHVYNWVARKGRLEIPFSECKGLGPKILETIKQYQDSQVPGFFKKEKPVLKDKLLKILQEIGAFGSEQDELPETIDSYFLDLGITLNYKYKYKNLYALIGDKEVIDINNYLSADLIGHHYGRELKEDEKIINHPELIACISCSQRVKCKSNEHPIQQSAGQYNVAIITEAPNYDEVKSNKYLESRDGDILWNELNKYGFEKEFFHRTSFVKCPCKKPDIKVIKECGSRYLKKELENIRFVLSIGNTGLGYFGEENKGIIRKNGTCEWNEENSCWVVYVIPPGWVSWKSEDFKKPFKDGIKKFVDVLERTGGFI
ncbi:MAG: DNA polymerase III subunit alpha [Melioribacteraceae bacterium]